MTQNTLTVEIVYALAERQSLLAMTVLRGTTVDQALAGSGLYELHPELLGVALPTGIFGRIVGRDHVLEDGDRIELYRPLVADPKASRNARVAKKRSVRTSGRNMRA
ncbi:MAG: RnfH family protein [Betaproteobacteria bacterium]